MIIIWCDWKVELHAFCSHGCLRHYECWIADPGYLFEKATWTGASFGCLWCGGDLTEGLDLLVLETSPEGEDERAGPLTRDRTPDHLRHEQNPQSGA